MKKQREKYMRKQMVRLAFLCIAQLCQVNFFKIPNLAFEKSQDSVFLLKKSQDSPLILVYIDAFLQN